MARPIGALASESGGDSSFAQFDVPLWVWFAFLAVGAKMIASHWFHIPTPISLGVIAGVLTIAIVASIRFDRPDGHGPDEVLDAHVGEGLDLLDGEAEDAASQD